MCLEILISRNYRYGLGEKVADSPEEPYISGREIFFLSLSLSLSLWEWKREGTVTETVWVWNTTYSKMSMAELFLVSRAKK